MKIKITQKIKDIIDSLGNKTVQTSGLKIYAALYLRNKRKNTSGYFDCPSTYLRSINSRYSKIINRFIEEGIIDYLKTLKIDPNDIFQTIASKKYSSDLGYCMKYKFLVDISSGQEIEVDFNSNRKKRWYEITANSLLELGYTPEIKRDSFGRRVHYPILNNYKEELKNKGLCVIDSKTSQPRLLWLMMQKQGIIDPAYHAIFTDDAIDFYEVLAQYLNLKDRDKAKKPFTHWVNGKNEIANVKIQKLFPIATCFIRGLKKLYYKDSASYLQREEAKIWIDDLLQNIPVDFALPVHDSLIIKREDLNTVLEYCMTKYPELRFSKKEL
ncbi:hypothetical protein CAP35_06510 [Chitinophagaceae bacterium IBVUCB1]|nr:hypothetical protein CAP35_06510 [Chitinophagaceae bacterium IBVUCB1]